MIIFVQVSWHEFRAIHVLLRRGYCIAYFCDSRNYGANYAIQDHFEGRDRKIWKKKWIVDGFVLYFLEYVYIYILRSYVVYILLEDLSILVKRDEFSKWIWLWSSYPCFSGLLMDSLCNVWNFFKDVTYTMICSREREREEFKVDRYYDYR